MRKVRWGVLGTADIAWGQTIPGMRRAEHCELYAVAGRKTEKAEKYRDAFGFKKAYTGYDALLEDPEVEAVYIPLPNDLHCEWTKKALKAKKHVLCEKPLAVNEKQAEEMFRRAIGVMKRQPNGELERAITLLNMADLAEAKLGAEAAEEKIQPLLEEAEALLNTESLPRNGYYAFVCEKCAPVFGHYGWFVTEAELRKRAGENCPHP